MMHIIVQYKRVPIYMDWGESFREQACKCEGSTFTLLGSRGGGPKPLLASSPDIPMCTLFLLCMCTRSKPHTLNDVHYIEFRDILLCQFSGLLETGRILASVRQENIT